MDLMKTMRETIEKELKTIQSDEARIDNISKKFRDLVYLYEAQGCTINTEEDILTKQLQTRVDEWETETTHLLNEEDAYLDVVYHKDVEGGYLGIELLLMCGNPTFRLDTRQKTITGTWETRNKALPLSAKACDIIDEYFENLIG